MTITYKDIPGLIEKHGSLSATVRKTGVPYSTLRKRYREAVEANLMDPLPMGRRDQAAHKAPQTRQRVKALQTKRDTHHTFILTCAQNNTDVHLPTWTNLLALAEHENAKIFVSTFLYSKRGLGARNDKAKLNRKSPAHDIQEELWFDPRVVPFINNDRVEIAKGLVWCGELNIIPTASSPLTKLEVYTGRKSMIAPHVTQQMQSIAAYGEGDGAKLNFATGTVTQRNYIQRKEGFAAEFHHMYGAVIAEVDEAGHWWVRQLNADSDGTIYDLDLEVKDGKVRKAKKIESFVEAVTGGDTHEDEKDPVVHAIKYAPGGMIDVLRPKYNFVHDLLNFARRGHHTRKDPYHGIQMFVEKRESVEDEIAGCRNFLQEIKRDWMQTVVVNSNHNRHLDRWLSDVDGRFDPVNAKYWSELNTLKINLIYAGKGTDLFGLCVAGGDKDWDFRNRVRFLQEDEGFITCKAFGGGIENGMHFDRGANGAKGSLRQFAKMGRRSNGGHSHTAGGFQGAMQAGTNSKKKLSYNHGASSWSQTDIITYINSKRTFVTFAFGKWRA